VDEGDEQWSLSRFAPLMQEVLEDLAANKLNFDEYPYVQPPSNDSGNSPMHSHPQMTQVTPLCTVMFQ